MISPTRLRAVVSYDRTTGSFVWIARLSNRVRVGDPVGRAHARGYVAASIDGVSYYLHRLAWLYEYGVLPTGEIDHINGDPSDNRIANLRDVTHQQNIHNARGWKRASSSFKGVHYTMEPKRRKRWTAQIKVNGVYRYLGRFHTEREAAVAYSDAARAANGVFARTA